MENPATETIESIFPPLTGRMLKAFTMKFDGQSYKEISIEIHWTEGHIRNLFSKGGRWHDHFKAWEEERIKEIEAEGRARIKKRITEAMTVQETVLTMVKSNPREAARAARDLLDRAGLKAPEKIEVSDPADQADAIMKWIENKNKNIIKPDK
jgi:hypothetical protein